jgi:tetratricopeptide (TPR) repeat protein
MEKGFINVDTHYTLSIVHNSQGRYRDAIRSADNGLALACDGAKPKLLMEKSKSYARMNNPTEALAWLQYAHVLSPSADTHQMLGEIYGMMPGNYKELSKQHSSLAMERLLREAK